MQPARGQRSQAGARRDGSHPPTSSTHAADAGAQAPRERPQPHTHCHSAYALFPYFFQKVFAVVLNAHECTDQIRAFVDTAGALARAATPPPPPPTFCELLLWCWPTHDQPFASPYPCNHRGAEELPQDGDRSALGSHGLPDACFEAGTRCAAAGGSGAAPRRAGATCQCAAVTASDRHCYAAATACQGRAASKQGGCQAMRVVATRPLHRALPPPRQFVPQPACTSMHAGGGV